MKKNRTSLIAVLAVLAVAVLAIGSRLMVWSGGEHAQQFHGVGMFRMGIEDSTIDVLRFRHPARLMVVEGDQQGLRQSDHRDSCGLAGIQPRSRACPGAPAPVQPGTVGIRRKRSQDRDFPWIVMRLTHRYCPRRIPRSGS